MKTLELEKMGVREMNIEETTTTDGGHEIPGWMWWGATGIALIGQMVLNETHWLFE
jgi:hypothetical protein